MKYIFLSTLLLAFIACSASSNNSAKNNNEKTPSARKKARKLSEEAKNYWYKGGGAEITSYKLTQARYGELRNGEAVMVFVTEPFSPSSNTKADNFSKDNVSVLKLNFTKRFNTGIYPYSMMNSSFFPMEEGFTSVKVSTSVQEWCGHVYMELRNKEKYELDNFSYFEGESFKKELDKVELEDDLWSKIRLNPEMIQNGNTTMIPPFFYLRLLHKEAKGYACSVKTIENKDGSSEVQVSYPELDRNLNIRYSTDFPHSIESWTESYIDGWGEDAKRLETKGVKMKSIRSKYWEKHDNSDEGMRTELGLSL